LDCHVLIRRLSRYGLVTARDDGNLEMHELIQEVIRDGVGTPKPPTDRKNLWLPGNFNLENL